MKSEQFDLVYVEWVDVVSDPENGWCDPERTDEFFDRDDMVVKEVGFVWKETEHFLCLLSRYMPSDDVTVTGHRTKIPKAWILYRENIVIKPHKIPNINKEKSDI
jgi:hypothetical protein